MSDSTTETSASTGRRWIRRLALAAGAALLAGVLLWLAAAPVVTAMLERDLRRAGYPDAAVTGVSVTAGGLVVGQIRLAADAFVLEGVRARIGAAGVTSLAVDRVRLEAEVTPDGRLVLPRADDTDDGAPPLGLVPAEGLTVRAAEVSLATPGGPAVLSLADMRVLRMGAVAEATGGYVLEHRLGRLEGRATAELADDGGMQARVRLAGGRIDVGAVSAAGLTGDIAAAAPAGGAAEIDLAVDAAQSMLAGRAAGALRLTAARRQSTVEFTLESQDAAPVNVALEGRAELRADASSLAASGRVLLDRASAGGELAFDLHVNGWNDGGRLAGRVQLDGRALTVPELFSDASIRLAGDIAGDAEELSISSTSAWMAELTPAPALLPDAMRALAGERLVVAIAPAREEPLQLLVALTERSARLDAAVSARAAEANLQATGGFVARWTQAVSLRAAPLRMAAEMLPWGDVILGVEGFEGVASYGSAEWQLRGAGRLHGSGTAGGASFDRLTVRWAGTISGNTETLAVVPDECVEWQLAALEWRDMRVQNVTAPCVRASDGAALITYRQTDGGTELAGATREAPLAAELVRAGESIAMRGTWPALDLTATIVAEGLTSLRATLAGGAFALPAANVTVAGLDGAAEMRDGALTAANVTAASIESQAEPALWAPLRLEATARADGDGLGFEALLSDALGVFVLEAAGRYEDERGSADITLHPLQLLAGASEVADVSPFLAGLVTNASGSVGFEGELAWDADGIRSGGTLNVRGFAATVSGVPVAGLNTATAFNSLLPPATPPGQTMQIGTLDLGVPLENGTVVYAVTGDGQVAIQQLAFDLAGGRLSTDPFTLDSAELGDIRLVLRAEDVELSQLLVLSRIDGLQGTGVLSGSVPVRIADGSLRLDEGVLAAETDGVLRYTPEDLPSFLQGDDMRSRMLREALTNFQYDELAVSITGESGEGGEQRVTLSAKGANPDFLEGHPIELNFNFQGPLLGAMRSAVELSGSEGVQQMFEQQGAAGAEETP